MGNVPIPPPQSQRPQRPLCVVGRFREAYCYLYWDTQREKELLERKKIVTWTVKMATTVYEREIGIDGIYLIGFVF